MIATFSVHDIWDDRDYEVSADEVFDALTDADWDYLTQQGIESGKIVVQEHNMDDPTYRLDAIVWLRNNGYTVEAKEQNE